MKWQKCWIKIIGEKMVETYWVVSVYLWYRESSCTFVGFMLMQLLSLGEAEQLCSLHSPTSFQYSWMPCSLFQQIILYQFLYSINYKAALEKTFSSLTSRGIPVVWLTVDKCFQAKDHIQLAHDVFKNQCLSSVMW